MRTSTIVESGAEEETLLLPASALLLTALLGAAFAVLKVITRPVTLSKTRETAELSVNSWGLLFSACRSVVLGHWPVKTSDILSAGIREKVAAYRVNGVEGPPPVLLLPCEAAVAESDDPEDNPTPSPMLSANMVTTMQIREPMKIGRCMRLRQRPSASFLRISSSSLSATLIGLANLPPAPLGEEETLRPPSPREFPAPDGVRPAAARGFRTPLPQPPGIAVSPLGAFAAAAAPGARKAMFSNVTMELV